MVGWQAVHGWHNPSGILLSRAAFAAASSFTLARLWRRHSGPTLSTPPILVLVVYFIQRRLYIAQINTEKCLRTCEESLPSPSTLSAFLNRPQPHSPFGSCLEELLRDAYPFRGSEAGRPNWPHPGYPCARVEYMMHQTLLSPATCVCYPWLCAPPSRAQFCFESCIFIPLHAAFLTNLFRPRTSLRCHSEVSPPSTLRPLRKKRERKKKQKRRQRKNTA